MEAFSTALYFLYILVISTLLAPLPVRDHRNLRYRSIPWMTITLIIINCAVFLLWQWPHIDLIMNAQTEAQFLEGARGYMGQVWTYGFRPEFMRAGLSIGAFVSFTSMFMHGGFDHLIGNMIFLWAFAPRVEDACGPWRFLLFYLLAGIMTKLAGGVILSPLHDVPSIGASGAISGVMGAYLVLFPGNHIGALWIGGAVTLRPIYWLYCLLRRKKAAKFSWIVPIPALLLVGFFIVFDIKQTFDTLQTGELIGGVNYVAHATGFLTAIFVPLFVRKDVFTRYLAGRML